jgi:hypothetical protein
MRLPLLAAALLPFAGLSALWAWSEQLSHEGTEWEVPIEGYDPRDLLRGHYVEFTYDWPIPERDGQTDDERVRFRPPPQALCLSGDAPRIAEAVPFGPADEAALENCAHPVIADPGSLYGPASLRTGRLYVGQDRAPRLSERLRDRDVRGIVRFRQRSDGAMTVQGIRFRPLRSEERAAREREGIEPTAPPIMEEPATSPNE